MIIGNIMFECIVILLSLNIIGLKNYYSCVNRKLVILMCAVIAFCVIRIVYIIIVNHKNEAIDEKDYTDL